MDETFIAKRITELRLAQNISEYQMSLELGQSKSYIQNITSGKNMPSVKQLFNIADYFHMSLTEFFDTESHEFPAVYEAMYALRELTEEDAALVLSFAKRLSFLRQQISDKKTTERS